MLGAFFDLGEFGKDCGHGGPGSQRGRWGFEGFMGDFWGARGPRGRGWKARAGRVFEQGDLKYVILRLLAEKPRHGYEIIKELEDRFGGAYAPSPGTLYPDNARGSWIRPGDARGRRAEDLRDHGRRSKASRGA